MASLRQARHSAYPVLFLQCEGCGHGLIAVVSQASPHALAWMTNTAGTPGQIIDRYPKIEALKCPADVPPNVAKAFLSGLDNLGRNGGTDAAAIMFRRSIGIAAKAINPTALKGDNLKQRIIDLSPDVATPAMNEWAQHIRLDANDATHEPEEFSPQDTQKLHIFAEMFLTYAFTLAGFSRKPFFQAPSISMSCASTWVRFNKIQVRAPPASIASARQKGGAAVGGYPGRHGNGSLDPIPSGRLPAVHRLSP
jgi:hypothetical protein